MKSVFAFSMHRNNEEVAMSKEKNLIKNTGILAIGTLSSKVFTFFLLPIYTAVLLPEDYGAVDVLYTVCNLLLYFITLQVESALFRFIIENRKDEDHIKHCVSTSFCAVGVMLSITTLLLGGVNYIYPIEHLVVVVLCIWSSAIKLLLLNMARGFGENILYSFASFLITISSLVTNLVLILGFHSGAVSILIAIIVSNFVGATIVFVKMKTWKYLFFDCFDKQLLREMLQYSVPLIPNAISWWIANTSDRLLIAWFIGTTANGIYAAANKIPTIYTIIFNVYNMAWVESISLAILEDDYENYISSVYKKSYKFLAFLCLGMITSISLLFNFLIGKNYTSAYIHILILLIAVFINSMCSLEGGILSAFKNSKATGTTTMVGAIVNFIINITLIKIIGLYAASVSTLLSYVVIYILRRANTKKYVTVSMSYGFDAQFLLMLIIVGVGYISKNTIINILLLMIVIIWGVINNKEIIGGLCQVVYKKMGK